MSDMDLYDPEFPCDPDLLDGSDAAANQDTDVNIVANTTHDECSQLQLSSIELPPEPYKPELLQNAETNNSSNKEHSSRDCAKAADSTDYPKKSNSSVVTENSFNKIEDADGDDAIEDDARYRDELKKLTAVRQTKDLELKAAKDVPLEIYLGPSVGFRVDLTMNKNRKLNVESIAKKRHDDMFERLSPEHRGKAKSDAKSGEAQSGSKTDFKPLSKTPVKSDIPEELSGEVFRQKKSGHNERCTLIESGEESDKDLRSLLRKREAENQALLGMPRVLKMKHTDGKAEENLVVRSDETPSSRKSRPRENDRDNVELSNRKKVEYGSEPKRSKHRRHEMEIESDHTERKDGSSLRKSNVREKEKEPKEKDSKRLNSSKHVRDEYESRHRSEERPRGKNENKELSSSMNKSRDRERPPESDTDPDHRARRKRRNSRSASNEHKKKQRKSKSRSPKRKRDRSKSGDRRRTKDGRSRSQELERRHEKKSETKPKNDDRRLTPTKHKKDDRHRHHRSRSKTPVREQPESKKATRLRHSDLKESSYYEEQWAFDEGGPRSDRNKSRQPSLRELQERSTSLLEACMKTRYENQGSGDDRHRSHRHRHQNKHDFVQSLNFGRSSGKPGSVDYITLSDSDEGIVWSDNDEGYGNYSCLPVRSDSSKKQKYEDIYSSRNLQCVENRLPSRSPPKPPKTRSQKESSLSPSEIIAINMKRKENSKKIEKLKITKSVSRSSLEPGEIDDGSSLDLSDNGLIEDTAPTRRTVSLINEDEANRRPGDKVPIQIHVITSHGDGRGGKADEIMSTTDCDENITGFVTTTDDAVGTAVFPERGKQKTEAQPRPQKEMCADEHDSDDKELAGDLVICTDNSPLNVENHELHLKAEHDGLDLVYDTQMRQSIERPVAEDFKQSLTEAQNSERQMVSGVSVPDADAKTKDIFDFISMKDDSSCSSPKTEAIPGLGDAFPSPVKELEIEPLVSTRNLSSFYHIKKKTHLEQASLKLDVNAESATQKAHGPHLASPRKALFQKEDLTKATQYSSPRKSPNLESVGAMSHQMPSTLPQSVPGLSKTVASSGRMAESPSTVDGELPPALPSDRQSSKVGIPKPTPSTNAYMLNQNAIVDLLASFPSSSSALGQQPVSAAVVTSHDDNPISKLLAAFNPMLATFGTASSTNSQSQKLIDDIVKSTSVVSGSSPQLSIESKSGSATDDRLTNIFNMQKKLLELTRISAATPQPAAPISQKLVQDIFKAVLVPTSSAKSSSDMSNLCPRASELPVSLSEENSLSQTSPFNVDAASPLSGEIMSFSPPSIPDTNSPAKKMEKTPKQTKPTTVSKNSTQKTKSKDGKLAKVKPEEDVRDKKV